MHNRMSDPHSGHHQLRPHSSSSRSTASTPILPQTSDAFLPLKVSPLPATQKYNDSADAHRNPSAVSLPASSATPAAATNPNPHHLPLLIGLNLPAEEPYFLSSFLPINGQKKYTDSLLVQHVIKNNYDFLTSRISAPSYLHKIKSQYFQTDDALKVAHSLTPLSLSSSLPPPSSYDTPYDALLVPPLDPEDALLVPGPHLRNVVAITAPWVELDSNNPRIAALAVHVLIHEITYAVYCGITKLIVQGPKRRTNLDQYSRAMAQVLTAVPPHVSVLLSLSFAEDDYISSRYNARLPQVDPLTIWDVWNTIRTANNYPPNLFVALQIPKACNTIPPVVLSRWYAEPVAMLTISASIFMPNQKGYPVLPKATQALLMKFFNKSPHIVLSDIYSNSGESDSEDSKRNSASSGFSASSTENATTFFDDSKCPFTGGYSSFLIYIRHLLRVRPKPSPVMAFGATHRDVLQLPLQPLADNLENAMYAVFERDPVKYTLYERAILAALMDLPPHISHVTIVVAGAGRGPLVDRALNAAKHAHKSAHVYALEKNAAAYIGLCQKLNTDWTAEKLNSHYGDFDDDSIPTEETVVEVIRCDMRTWKVPQNPFNAAQPTSPIHARSQLPPQPPTTQYAHIIVSELLGSFGDNELSPECLDALDTHNVLDPEVGVMIPQSYTAWFTPAMSPTLYTSAAAFPLPRNQSYSAPTASDGASNTKNSKVASPSCSPDLNSSNSRTSLSGAIVGLNALVTAPQLHTPYVVLQDAVDYVAPNQIAKAWTFNHPSAYGARLLKEYTNTTSNSPYYRMSPLDAISLHAPTGGSGLGNHSAFNIASQQQQQVSPLVSPVGGGGPSAHSLLGGPAKATPSLTTIGSTVSTGGAPPPASVAAAVAASKTLLPVTQYNMHNTRKAKHTFYIPHQCVVHGIAGYFECVLYKDIGFSTRPDTPIPNESDGLDLTTTEDGRGEKKAAQHEVPKIPYSEQLVSWFPLWLPLSAPLYVPENAELDVALWRETDGSRVWYEWVAEAFIKEGGLAKKEYQSPTAPTFRQATEDNKENSGAAAGNRNSSASVASTASTNKQEKYLSDVFSKMQEKRRVRVGVSEVHNRGGMCYSMAL